MLKRHKVDRMVKKIVLACAVFALSLVGALSGARADGPQETARRVLQMTGVEGGLVVHYGCGNGRLTAALRAHDGFLVQGLARESEPVKKARKYVRSTGKYGPVSVQQWNAERLPYVDNLVNLFVATEPPDVPRQEIMRVLAPGGVACVLRDGKWTKSVKQRPDTIDEWTHHFHDATNNAVARDKVVGPPRHMQWQGWPRWARHHDRMASLSACVTAGDRLFYIMDEGPRAAIMLPPRWRLVARNAFSGKILWKREIPRWHPHLWPMKSGYAQLPRRLVASGDRVYTTLGLEEPLKCLDAATGETIRTYPDTRCTREVLFSDGVLYVVAKKAPPIHEDFRPAYKGHMWNAMRRAAHDWPWDETERRIMAMEADTGEVLWSSSQHVAPLSLAIGEDGVYFHDGMRVVRLDRQTGRKMWESGKVAIHFPYPGKTRGEDWAPESIKRAFVPTSFGPSLVVHGDTVLFAGGDDTMTALSADEGKKLWTEEHLYSGHFSPQDLFVIDGLAWSGETASGRGSGLFVGRNLRTGAAERKIECDADVFFMHQRCYPGKATERYFIPSWTGTEFVSLKDGHWDINHWVRGGCVYGNMPANGLLYATPHSCACYMVGKLYGFNALAPASQSRDRLLGTAEENRLHRGTAYGKVEQTGDPGKEDWPTYRHDSERSGSTGTAVPADLKVKWRVEPGGKISSPVIANGRIYVNRIDSHAVCALDEQTGRTEWTFTAGGRVDSPPTIWRGRAFFGCADGWVYCLRASDGALVWKFRAAPRDYRLSAFDQLESPWPVHGSVLVQDGELYCVAGRSAFLDGGMRFLRLDPETGRKISETKLDSKYPDTGKNLQSGIQHHNIAVGLPDVLSSDGEHVYMRTQRFTMKGVREDIGPHSGDRVREAAPQAGEGVHLFSPIGFLDGSWWHRSYWVYGRRFAQGAGGYPAAGHYAPAGRIMVVGQNGVYGYGRKPQYFTWTTPLEYRLFGAAREFKQVEVPVHRGPRGKRPRIKGTRPIINWSHEVPLQARGMVLAGDRLFIAGHPDVVDEERAFNRLNQEKFQRKLHRQRAALEGKEGALLRVVSPADGSKLAQYRMDSPPRWDGMAAANGRLYVATLDGELLCLGAEGQDLSEYSQPEREIENPDLVGHWSFDEGKGRLARDSSERYNDGQVIASWVDGKFGTGLEFDGKDDRVQVADHETLNFTGSITIAAWARPGKQQKDIPLIVFKGRQTGQYIMRVTPNNRLFATFWKEGKRTTKIETDQPLSDGWHHVAVTYDPAGSKKLRLYVDGRLAKEKVDDGGWGEPRGRDLTISGRNNQAYHGLLDEVYLYNRALSPDEVKALAERTPDSE